MTESGDTWPAPAKINRFLHVTGRRADGYHELQTLFQILDWGDRVRISLRRDGQIHRRGADYGVPETADLVVRAAELLRQKAGTDRGADIEVEKRVPLGSGLGGGSSDAATVLLVLNRLWDCGLSLDDLAVLGETLGADVPVFVRGRTALATGIGERLRPIRLGKRHYVLVFPGIPVSTAEVFNDPALVRNSPQIGTDEILAGAGWNDCEPVVRKRYPAIDQAMRALAEWGRVRMTGTGSTLFIEMNDEKQANSAAREIKSLYNTRAVTGVDCSTVHQKLYPDGN